ncbi:MAG: hypothetical protein ACRERU_22565 [Methylococcales bacterium]
MIKVDRQLPGRPALKKFEQRRDFPDGYSVLRLWLPSCGGVGIEIPSDPKFFHQGWSDQLNRFRKELLSARVPDQSTWQYAMVPQGSFPQIERRLNIRRINQHNRHFIFMHVQQQGNAYWITQPDGAQFAVKSAKEFGEHLQSMVYVKEHETVYLEMSGFQSPLKEEAFTRTVNIQQIKSGGGMTIRQLHEMVKPFLARELAFSEGHRPVDKATAISKVENGPRKGMYTAVINVGRVTPRNCPLRFSQNRT